jgi:predicted nucleic acid-binding protein
VGLLRELGDGPVGLDTAPLIYFVEAHRDYLSVVEPLFEAIDAGRLTAVTSALMLLEALVVPLRSGDLALAGRYEVLLRRSRGLELVDLSPAVLRDAAALRAVAGVRTPDAIQLAAALSRGCRAFVTNDRALPTVRGMKIVQLRDFLQAPPLVSKPGPTRAR